MEVPLKIKKLELLSPPRSLLRSLAPFARREGEEDGKMSVTQFAHKFTITIAFFAVRSFICKLVSVEWIILVELLEPPFLFFFLGFFWVCWEFFEGLV
jgi:hypothetical protein